ncbi:hypothetical protein [Cohnella phaseoli]|uniref:Uncharacterized protein n=1 Tax=Cohnella phaseoli TaxID=456490 RepID=A0A3D9JQ09_9BACL|nr:hypothetical protein [Cohnella phaseoli]RED76114.1 hypothetical protein DFP98_113175 [Cohnella phaseoli]
MLRKVIDNSMTNEELLLDPGNGKFRIEIPPHQFAVLGSKKFFLILLVKQLKIAGIPLPLKYRIAVISRNDDAEIERVLRNEFPAYDIVELRKATWKVYPYCQIHLIDFSTTSTIYFETKNQMDQWEKPIEHAICKLIFTPGKRV